MTFGNLNLSDKNLHGWFAYWLPRTGFRLCVNQTGDSSLSSAKLLSAELCKADKELAKLKFVPSHPHVKMWVWWVDHRANLVCSPNTEFRTVNASLDFVISIPVSICLKEKHDLIHLTMVCVCIFSVSFKIYHTL